MAAETVKIHWELGQLFREAGLLVRTAEEFTDAAKGIVGSKGFDGKSVEMIDTIAWLLTTCPDVSLQNPSLAVEVAKKNILAYILKGGNNRNTLGVAQYRMGDWKAAVETLEKSINPWTKFNVTDTPMARAISEETANSLEVTNKGDAQVAFIMAMTRLQFGDQKQARELFDKAVKWIGMRTSPKRRNSFSSVSRPVLGWASRIRRGKL